MELLLEEICYRITDWMKTCKSAEVDKILRPKSNAWSEQIKPPKQILLRYAMKTLKTRHDLNSSKCLIFVATESPISSARKSAPSLCLHNLASTSSDIPLPDIIQPHVSITLAWDKIDRLEETLSSSEISHS